MKQHSSQAYRHLCAQSCHEGDASHHPIGRPHDYAMLLLALLMTAGPALGWGPEGHRAVAMIGTDVVNPPGKNGLRFGRVTVRFGKPMDFSRFEGLAGNRFIERAVTDEVIYELMGLSGQEYVDIYAASVKQDSNGAGSTSEATRIPETAVG